MKKAWILNRRNLLMIGGKILTTGAFLGGNHILLGCGQTSFSSSGPTNSDSTNTDSDTSYDTGTGSSDGWASGGTELITSSYPSDSIFTAANTCAVAVSQETTLGPCYFADTTGEDISLGFLGLPMQLCLQLVDSNCNPLSGYKIEVWHCDTRGIYSGDTSSSSNSSSFAGDFCTGGDALAKQSTWFRGLLTTNSSGRVNFKTCFPGWYSGRTIHIHFAVVDSSNRRQLISQLCFTDDFADEICTTHSLYKSRGTQDTPISQDNVFPSNATNFTLKTAQNSDGSLLAYHTIKLV